MERDGVVLERVPAKLFGRGRTLTRWLFFHGNGSFHAHMVNPVRIGLSLFHVYMRRRIEAVGAENRLLVRYMTRIKLGPLYVD